MGWRQYSVRTAYAEFADEILIAQGALAVTVTDAADAPILEPRPGETPIWDDAVVTGLFGEDLDADAVGAALSELLPDGASAEQGESKVADEDWVRVCLRDARPMRFGKRLWVCPSNHEVDDEQAVVVKLDPGLAFGTGTHPTTALCLRWLEAQDLNDCTVLDFGCGSGILSVAALLLGAKSANGVDIDPQALVATAANAQTNGVAERLRVLLPDAFSPRSHDRVVANILAAPLIELAPLLTQCLAPGGRMALSGLLQAHADSVIAAYAPFIRLTMDAQDGDWIRLSGTRNSGTD